eukprot:g45328.t1
MTDSTTDSTRRESMLATDRPAGITSNDGKKCGVIPVEDISVLPILSERSSVQLFFSSQAPLLLLSISTSSSALCPASATSCSSRDLLLTRMKKVRESNLVKYVGPNLCGPPMRVVLSGPSGFLGRRVLDALVEVHDYRRNQGLDPGEVLLLSASPGNLMRRLQNRYGPDRLSSLRASRVDYYTQHGVDMWHDHLGSLGLGGRDCVFLNLAGVAGPVQGKEDAMCDVNYKAPIAAAEACMRLEFGHWIQSSSQAVKAERGGQAVKAERGGQVPYSRWKAMIDYGLSRATESMPVSIAFLGLLYAAEDGNIGQRPGALNLADTVRFPLCPIMGDGTAPLQPLEVRDAAERLAFLALTDPAGRPYDMSSSIFETDNEGKLIGMTRRSGEPPPRLGLRTYDAVGPEVMSIVELLERFAYYQNCTFRPVYIDYRRMERLLNVKPLGNLNRQFVSLLRSEQQSKNPRVGNPEVFQSLIPGASLTTLDQAFLDPQGNRKPELLRNPYLPLIKWVWENPKVIVPGILVLKELLFKYIVNAETSPLTTTSLIKARKMQNACLKAPCPELLSTVKANPGSFPVKLY